MIMLDGEVKPLGICEEELCGGELIPFQNQNNDAMCGQCGARHEWSPEHNRWILKK